MERSEQLNELAAALAKAQAELEGASKDGNNPHFKSKYATLESAVLACKAVLPKHGLSVSQFPSMQGDYVTVETILMHSSGQFLSGILPVPVSKKDAQGIGSAITYGRRYSLMAVVGIAPEDDDGNAAVQGGPVTTQPTRAPAVQTPEEDRLDWDDILPAVEGIEQLNAAKSREPYRILAMAMRLSRTEAELYEWAKDDHNTRTIWSLTPEARHHLREAFNTYLETL
jgi:hypothetical protein